MRNSPVVIFLSLAALAAACNGGNAAPQPNGPAHLGVIAGNHQTVNVAPAVKLPDPVVAQVVRLPNGQVALRVLDAVLPEKAYAQTAVNGIPGAVVCAVSPDPTHPLTPEVPCTNTDLTGKAYFTFHADTVAGIARSQVRGTVNDTTHVSDSVSATVLPLQAADFTQFLPVHGDSGTIQHVGDTLDLRVATATHVEDKYHNALTSYLIRYRRTNATPNLSDAALVTGDKMVIRSGDRTFDLAVDSIVHAAIPLQVRP